MSLWSKAVESGSVNYVVLKPSCHLLSDPELQNYGILFIYGILQLSGPGELSQKRGVVWNADFQVSEHRVCDFRHGTKDFV